MRRIVTFVFVTATVVVTAAVAFAAASPKAVRASIVAAALAQSSVHWTSTLVGHGEWRRTVDVGPDSATEQYSISVGRNGAVQILLVANTIYVQGDAFGLEYSLGLTEAQAMQYAGQWISIPNGDTLYDPAGFDLTLPAIVHQVIPQGKLTVSWRKWRRERLVDVRGTAGTGHFKLTAYAQGNRLPVSFSGGGIDVWRSVHFTEWNERVNVQVPASSTPIATVRG